MNECEILKWAAGKPDAMLPVHGTVLSEHGIDEQRLIVLIQRHRLANRFLARYREERPAWCSRALLMRLLALSHATTLQTQKQCKMMQEISLAISSRPYPVIPIKGFTTYALTGNPNHLRWAEDLDIFFCDLEYLHTTLFQLGYTEMMTFRFNQFQLVSCHDLHSYDHDLAPLVNGQHEFAKMERDRETRVEIHGYFPVFAYPEGVLSSDLLPAHYTERWIQSFPDTTARGILYKDLLKSSVSGTAPETRGFLFPNPTMSVFLCCAHIFAHYVVVGPFDNWMPVKLVELAEINDLARDARFNKTHFRQLMHKFGGQDAVNLVNYLLNAYLDSEVLMFASTQLPSSLPRSFPRFLQWWQCWATYYTSDTIDQLLLPTHLDAVIDYLGTNTISVSEGKTTPVFSSLALEQTSTLKRVILHSKDHDTISLQFCVTLNHHILHFDIEILTPLIEDNHRYELNIIGRHTIHQNYIYPINQDDAGWIQEPEGRTKYIAHFSYTWNEPATPFFVLLMLGVQDTHRDFFFSFNPTILIPLKIVEV